MSMTPEQIREVVRITIDELTQRKLLNIESYNTKLRSVEVRLYGFFDNKREGKGVSKALHALSDDTYIDMIYMIYRDGKTLEWVAEYYDKDVSTIKRNKKRLINKLYELLEV